jgi:hypothetical protein
LVRNGAFIGPLGAIPSKSTVLDRLMQEKETPLGIRNGATSHGRQVAAPWQTGAANYRGQSGVLASEY